MIDNEKLVALIRLRDLLYSGVQPTLRECGFSAEIIQGLVKEQLVNQATKNLATIPTDVSLKKSCPPGIRLSRSSTHSATDTTLTN